MSTNRPSFYAGLGLIALGIVFLVTYILPGSWPVVLVALGVFFLVVAALRRESWPVIAGLVNLTLGGILLYQTLSQNWSSWYFLWPLIFMAVGAGMLITVQMERAAGLRTPGATYQRVSWGWIGLGLAAAAAFWIFREQVSWPSILWGIGLLFLLEALLSGIGPFAIPGTILGGLGLMLAWQNQTGAWDSWAYTWALLPAFVGLGLFLAFLRSRVMCTIGLSMLGWSLVVFIVFGTFFAEGGAFAQFWPIALILGGVAVLAQGLINRRPVSPQ